jgi:hypothetical protein
VPSSMGSSSPGRPAWGKQLKSLCGVWRLASHLWFGVRLGGHRRSGQKRLAHLVQASLKRLAHLVQASLKWRFQQTNGLGKSAAACRNDRYVL